MKVKKFIAMFCCLVISILAFGNYAIAQIAQDVEYDDFVDDVPPSGDRGSDGGGDGGASGGGGCTYTDRLAGRCIGCSPGCILTAGGGCRSITRLH